MCKKLLLVVTLLSFASVASAEIPIDDFEAYWRQPIEQDARDAGEMLVNDYLAGGGNS